MPQNSRHTPGPVRPVGTPSRGTSVPPAPDASPARMQELARRREAILRKRKRIRRKRLILLGISALVLLAALTALLVFLVKTIIGILPDPDRPAPQDLDFPIGTEAADSMPSSDPGIPGIDTAGHSDPVTPDTAPVTNPPYDAPGILTGTPVVPHKTEATRELDTEIDCPRMVLMDAATGEILAAKNADDPIYPASMTKLMTVLAAYELLPDLDTTFRMTNTIIDPLYLDGLSLAGFVGGEEVTVRDMLYGTLLPSGAEAAVGLAIAASGSEEAFVEKMNARAASLGMKGTHFTNCSGHHDDNHYSTLGDIALLLAFMEQDETLAEILSTYQYTTKPTPQHPEGVLLTSTVFMRMAGDESVTCEVIGGKTGYTIPAGQCLATCGVRKDTGRAFICVLAGGETKWKPVYDTISLYGAYTAP